MYVGGCVCTCTCNLSVPYTTHTHIHTHIHTADQATVDAAQAQVLESFKEYKKSFQQALVLFNKKPKKGLAMLQQLGFVGRTPEDVARFLSKTQGLNKTTIGEYMGEKEDFAIKVMHAYTDALEFTEMTFDDALRYVCEWRGSV